ncbi:MAG: PIN domain-containing protein [Candidatus Aminicenantes bacterium]|nr:PIN domain-containing protein [Candidatus Aminicenantes bacterium]
MKKNNHLDTDIVIYWLKNIFPKINQKIEKINDERIFLSSITAAELYFGAYNSARKDENISLINDLLKEANVVDFNENTGKTFGEIKSALKTKEQIISDSDLFIAATAISNEFTSVTNNERHFKRIENLKIENWSG